MNPRLTTAIEAVTTAGNYLKTQFGKRHRVSLKSDNTELLGEDLESEKILIDTISRTFPSDSFCTEETETSITGKKVWVFDPICGSYSYLRGVETWSLSMALVENDQYILGVVYQPLLDNLFYSQEGEGVYCNDKQVTPSSVITVKNSFINIEHAAFVSGKLRILDLVRDMKRLRVGHGSGGELAYVASGRIDAVIKTDQTIVHFAGGRALVEEAGGVFIDFSGKRAPTYIDKKTSVDYIAASNQTLADNLLTYLST